MSIPATMRALQQTSLNGPRLPFMAGFEVAAVGAGVTGPEYRSVSSTVPSASAALFASNIRRAGSGSRGSPCASHLRPRSMLQAIGLPTVASGVPAQ
jgi:hypothetical protein